MNSTEIFNLVIGLIGGLALFLFGMEEMGNGLSKASGGKMEVILEKLTSNSWKAVLLGAGVTAVIQSSSATTVMVVGFVNSGIMKLSQAVGIIMGANVGTTITSWILSLAGIESSNFFVSLFKPANFSPILAMVGVIFLIFTKSEKKHNAGSILIGFAILMTGMEMMSEAVKPLKDIPAFTGILLKFSNPVLGLLAGAILTAVIQSSSASVGILQALCATGSVTFGTAVPIIMGQNIGTCVTAILSSIGTSKNAKRTACVHLYFNLIGTIIFMVIFYTANIFMKFDFLNDSTNAAGIAVVHSLFNIGATIVLLPFSKLLVKLACLTIKTEEEVAEEDKEFKILDTRFLNIPALAMEHCKIMADKMAKMSQKSLSRSIELIWNYNEEMANQVKELEERVDRYEDELGTYLVQLSSRRLATKDSQTLSEILHCIGDFERISDHAANIVYAAKEIKERKIVFSEEAKKEFEVFAKAVDEIVDISVKVFVQNDKKNAKKVEPLENVIKKMNKEVKKRHVARLRSGKCIIETGFILSNLFTDFERVADHCSNIAICIIQIQENQFDAHEYLETLDKGENTEFRRLYENYKRIYRLPLQKD